MITIGEISALAMSLCWAVTSIILTSQSHKMSAVSLNAWRSVFAAIFLLAALLVLGRTQGLKEVPLHSVAYLLGSVVVGLGLGDILYIKSLALIGASRALPITGAYPFFTMMAAFLFFHEPVTVFTFLAATLIISGVCLLALPERGKKANPDLQGRVNLKGVLFALSCALCWTVSSSFLKPALENIDLVAANFLRTFALALLLLLASGPRKTISELKKVGGTSIALVALTGVLGFGLGSFLFLVAMQKIGMARTVILSATSPLFGLPLSILFLKERATYRKVAGTLLSTLGIWLLIS